MSVARCRRADHLRTEEQLAPIALAGEAEPLTRGSVVHAGLAVAFAAFPAPIDEGAVAAACRAEAVERGLSARDARIDTWTRVTLRAARAVDRRSWSPVRLPVASAASGRGVGAGEGSDAATGRVGAAPNAHTQPQLVEHRLSVPLPDGDVQRFGDLARGWSFSFKPDGVMQRVADATSEAGDGGRTWLWDHKTKSKSTFSRVEPWTELHLQSLLYVRALRMLGVGVDGAVLYAVLADEPTVPKLRADGHVGEINWKTDWSTAVDVIMRSADPDPLSPRYDSLRAACAEREWQIPQEVVFTEAELDSAWDHLLACRDDMVRAAFEVQRARAEHDTRVGATSGRGRHLPAWKATTPTGRGASCERCEFFEWCREDFGGRDSEALIGSAYKRGADKYLAEVALTSQRECTEWVAHGDLDGIDRARARE